MKDIPKWLFAAAFFLLTVLLLYLAFTGRSLQYYPSLAFSPRPSYAIEVREVGNGDIVQAPTGTRENWTIVVVPAAAGREEPGSEEDNALQRVEFRAEPAEAAGVWKIIAHAKFNGWLMHEQAGWEDARALVLLIPRH
jgi:hypothetical protein